MQNEVRRLKAALLLSGGASSDFDLNPALAVPGAVLRPAAVLVPVWLHQGQARVILTKRASHLKHHPGQIALPGGKRDEGDASLEACALREAWEEIGLTPDRVELLGALPLHETVTGFAVTPILGLVREDFDPDPQVDEVEEVFTVPLPHLLHPGNYAIERRLWRGVWRSYYAVPYGPYYVWGATARMLRGLAERVAQCE
jgi:8-oxo-dGTP pyrophosphatase MutT (NUDIX family)